MRNHHVIRQLVIAIVLIGLGFITTTPADTLISPADPKINYYGRFDMTDPAKPAFNWSGAVIEAQFPGPTIGMKIAHLQDYSAYYDIEIDGVIDTVISCGSKQQFIFSTTLSPSMHILRIILRSEEHSRNATFQGLYLANGKQLGDAPAKPARKIEFIGDSYTAGYGIESPVRTCNQTELNKYTNANKAFPMLITKAFHAQSIILGWSGAGVVKNYGESTKRSAEPYPTYYDLLLGKATTQKWDFTKWIPDLVVICLGTNDFSTTPNPDDSMFVGDYHKLINRIVTNYPSAKIACLATTEDIIKRLVKKVVTEQNGTHSHQQVFAAAFPVSVENTACDWHPSIADNKKVAAVLVDTIMKKLSWDTTASTVTLPPPGIRTRQPAEFTITTTALTLHIATSSTAVNTLPVSLLSIDGRSMARASFNRAGKAEFTTTVLPVGMYLVGNNELGWRMVAVGAMR